MAMGEMWVKGLGSKMASLMFLWALLQQCFSCHLRGFIEKYVRRWTSFFNPYIQITFHEYNGDNFCRSKVYSAIESYLIANSSLRASRLRADIANNSRKLILSMDDYEEVTDEFHGVKLWWSSHRSISKTPSLSLYPTAVEKRYYKLTFHGRHRELVTAYYLNHVIDQGKAIEVRNRQRKLYTNIPSESWSSYRKTMWSHVAFQHPATFQTLAMEPEKKKEIVDDLVAFSKGKDYYARIGKVWKRGYLLYGPPGTGKSTMIAAMANLLDYDVYDIELTAVKDNTELRRLLLETSSKAIIVIEDIDCSLDLTGRRKKKEKEEDGHTNKVDPVEKGAEEEGKEKNSRVTLSGLLNFIDGIWSACKGERLIVFTTNHVDQLDPALIRRGRMDKHIELSYCRFEAFKVLAKNYLELDSHRLFERIGQLMGETKMTPADVAEYLMPKIQSGCAETCLENLIRALELEKEETMLKAEEINVKKMPEMLVKEEAKEGSKED
ncbi:PREDICTED: AAA-ATPase ASD, mitochondrial-like [Nelumbo nucifera]|uniref:AAA+ ATPase domain-containing protein n=2 Tax=Nelumbo nucifera TaxID=4432 RepID=A0A822YNY1_NELNU|nr:PREDICTED: AAA-ATPase ASD, mitochondrial-like [Nelumbo nucifera]DAD35904.1 TPA_asm: hypothetical protein HUJ06_006544 [Nelumbo nucifera]